MLPRRSTHRARLESGIDLRSSSEPRPTDAELEEALSLSPEESPEDEQRRRAYAAWLARFERRHAAA